MRSQAPAPNAKHGAAPLRILAAAEKLFADKGYDGTTIRQIAGAAEVTNPVIYYHFGSKEGLFISVIDEAMQDILQATEAAQETAETARGQLEAIVMSYTEYLANRTDLFRILYREVSGVGTVPAEKIGEYVAQIVDRIAEIIRAGISTHEFREVPPDLAALSLIGNIQVFVSQQLVTKTELSPTAVAKCVIDLFFRGICAEATSWPFFWG